ncbi:SAM-dependent DNA methyltransferase [Roseomonas stagni]|uniref:site-specific DNA-methyltransferase (adenine-specific) n=1 Tax=Falsiroseomonas algicola TaxID=2716930 RepID=A0A6M1LWJ2_9PROT|nr:DNA methyltransferase [Falsiroseomonas algicola]NGM24332.1 SAM-dependent DNA methyltransferase [Falsiroseomonas algicola]
MSTLDRDLRKTLEKTIRKAREEAEQAAADAIARLGVTDAAAPAYLSDAEKTLRVRLRAHARTLGDGWDAPQKRLLGTARLREAVAYEAWHRMLFGRFLVERGLLIHPDLGVAIGRDELKELAAEDGLPDEWALVERLAAPALPAVFRPDDPVLAVTLAGDSTKRLRDLVVGLPEAVFAAEDSLGWTYQFWRAAEKEAVNKKGEKIGTAELPAVTQLFTEPYMVKFLLHNTLGAWWAGKVLAATPDLAREAPDEADLRAACTLPGVAWEFLRFVREGEDGTGPWRPAAGVFPGWPQRAAEITFLDPCCGSGHFLVEAFGLLAALRRAEEPGLSGEEAACAVLRDNLHGLEIDGRCVQIAAFNVALAAWALAGGPISLPQPHIAWVGAQPPSRAEMAALANGDGTLSRALEVLHDQFAQAPLLGSLLEVGARDLLDADLRERGETALGKLRTAEPDRAEGAIAARGLMDAAALLTRRYVLQATNVPFLGRGKQAPALAEFISRRMPEAKADLAAAMLQRMRRLTAAGGAVASVTPQSWLFLGGYKAMRQGLLREVSLAVVAGLGPHAFETITGEVVNTALVVLRNALPGPGTVFAGVDANSVDDAQAKAKAIATSEVSILGSMSQLSNPDARIAVARGSKHQLLQDFAESYKGIATGDMSRFIQRYWENADTSGRWQDLQEPPMETRAFTACSGRVLWEKGRGSLREFVASRLGEGGVGAWLRGDPAWGHVGVAVAQMRDLPASLYTGALFDESTAAIIPKRDSFLPAIWAFLKSDAFLTEVRKIDRSLKVPTLTLLKVPFDFEKWSAEAAKVEGSGISEPQSDEVTQWLFHGHPAHAESGTELHVALARLAGYRWPAETDAAMRLSDEAREHIRKAASLPASDIDGLLTLHASGADRPLADRLRAMLAAAYGKLLSPAEEAGLVRAADERLDKKVAKDLTLEGWLRDRAFRQHCILFQHRPFLWQVWDGGREGFSAFLHYHRLDRAALEKLTHTLLGDWIARMKAEGRTAEESWAVELQRKLKLILHGEKPYDIFVRWKSLAQQPLGWEPDLDDGVRLNIRPFIEAGVLRETPKINWNKDRGTDPASAPWYDLGPSYGEPEGARINAHHLTRAEKEAARQRAAE